MRLKSKAFAFAFILSVEMLFALSTQAEASVDVAIVLAVDVSRSIWLEESGVDEYKLQKEGIVATPGGQVLRIRDFKDYGLYLKKLLLPRLCNFLS